MNDDSPNILYVFSDPAMQIAPRENLLAFLRHLKNSPAADVIEGEGFVRWRTGFPAIWFNGLLVTRPPRADESAFIGETIDYFRSQAVTEISWWLASAPGLESWRDMLLACCFRYDDNSPGMTVNVSQVQQAPLPAGLRIERVETPAALRTWCKLVVVGFGMAEDTGDMWYNITAPLGYERPVRYYLGSLDGEPVATSGLFFHEGVAGVYKVTTLEAARKKGIGAAMTVHALLEAREAGYRAAVLQASPLGFPIYRRIGFQTTCAIDLFSLKI